MPTFMMVWSDEQFLLLKCIVNVVSCGTQSIHYVKETKGMMDLWKSLFLLVLENVM